MVPASLRDRKARSARWEGDSTLSDFRGRVSTKSQPRLRGYAFHRWLSPDHKVTGHFRRYNSWCSWRTSSLVFLQCPNGSIPEKQP